MVMSNFNLEEATSYIKKWLDEFVTQPNPLLNNFPPCPYAQQAILDNKVSFEVAERDINLHLIMKAKTWDEKIDVCVIFVPDIATGELSSLVKSTNEIYLMEDNFVALEDHPDDEENINGVIMNNGKYPIVLMQHLSKIQMFSGFLKKKGYYDVWSKENLDDVVNWRQHHEDLVKSE
jgi:hypothetical protein